jgi:hypothetical protein
MILPLEEEVIIRLAISPADRHPFHGRNGIHKVSYCFAFGTRAASGRFYEEIPRLHVISAGSLLEFAIRKVYSFPVGRVEFLYLHPLNLLEYLAASGKNELIAHLQSVPVKPVTHGLLMDAFHRYAIIEWFVQREH